MAESTASEPASKGSREAKQATAVILETLSGLCTTTEAAERLGVTASRYYQLEKRALDGMMAALEPRRRGRQNTPERQIKALVAEKADLERELRRHQSLLRQASRSLGLRARPKAKAKAKGKRARRQAPRGKTVLQTLRQDLDGARDGPTEPGDGVAAANGSEPDGA